VQFTVSPKALKVGALGDISVYAVIWVKKNSIQQLGTIK
jgi:hypothetical protein